MRTEKKENEVKELSKHVGYFVFGIAFISTALAIALVLAKPGETLNFLISWLTLIGVMLGDYLLFKIFMEISE